MFNFLKFISLIQGRRFVQMIENSLRPKNILKIKYTFVNTCVSLFWNFFQIYKNNGNLNKIYSEISFNENQRNISFDMRSEEIFFFFNEKEGFFELIKCYSI